MAQGIVRKIDELGRLVIPIEMRKLLDIAEHDEIEICFDADKKTITLKKYIQGDIFDGSENDLIDYMGKKISRKSIIELAKLINLI